MKPHLVPLLRCTACRDRLTLEVDAFERVDRPPPEHLPACSGLCGRRSSSDGCTECAAIEVMSGSLVCGACGQHYGITDGIPWTAPRTLMTDKAKARTASSFGHLWDRSIPADDAPPREYHFEKMARALRFHAPSGLVLDAGCGDGIDLHNRARTAGVEVVGVELSAGGCRTTARRIVRSPNAHVVQADLSRLPFDDGRFDFVYSYGVLHHLPKPEEGLNEIARVARPGAPIAIYLYEDFSDRSRAWRLALTLANLPRVVTTHLPHRALYGLCQVGSPVVFLVFTLPHRMLRRVALLRSFADSLPFRHGKGPFSLTGDLYDRFSAPVEFRYSRASAEELLERAGLSVRTIAKERGWMALAERDEDALVSDRSSVQVRSLEDWALDASGR